MRGKKLQRLRKRLGLTQEAMARLLGVSFVSINRWEGNPSSRPHGPALTMLLALEGASLTRPKLGQQLRKLEAAGPNTLWAAVFKLARTRR